MSQAVDVLRDGELIEMFAQEPELLAICDAVARTRPMLRRRLSRRTTIVLAAAVALSALTAPALAVTRAVIDFFSSPAAPRATVVDFTQMSVGAPEGMDPRATGSEARTISRGHLADGRPVTLSIAPTTEGGFCYLVSFGSVGRAGGCDARRTLPFSPGLAAERYPQGPAIVYGSVLNPLATVAEIHTPEGTTTRLPLLRVSSPIDASFYVGEIPTPAQAFPLTTSILDPDGKVIASKTFPPPPLR
jgi:hypothetical protein